MSVLYKPVRFCIDRLVIMLMLYVSSFVLSGNLWTATIVSVLVVSGFLSGLRLAKTTWRYKYLILFSGIALSLLWLVFVA